MPMSGQGVVTMVSMYMQLQPGFGPQIANPPGRVVGDMVVAGALHLQDSIFTLNNAFRGAALALNDVVTTITR